MSNLNDFKAMMLQNRQKPDPNQGMDKMQILKQKREQKLKEKEIEKRSIQEKRREIFDKLNKKATAKHEANRIAKTITVKSKAVEPPKLEKRSDSETELERRKLKILKKMMAQERTIGRVTNSEADEKAKKLLYKKPMLPQSAILAQNKDKLPAVKRKEDLKYRESGIVHSKMDKNKRVKTSENSEKKVVHDYFCKV